MGTIQNGSFYSSYLGDQIDLLLAAMAQANPLPSGTDWVAFIDDCRAAQADAETAADDAATAKNAAELAAQSAETWSSNAPYIGTNGNWFLYDATQGAFVDSGLPSRGRDGVGLPTGGTVGQFLRKNSSQDGDASWVNLPTYDGSYDVTPLPLVETVMNTSGRYLDRNVVVKEIPYQEVSNKKGGLTATIGG